MFMKVIALYFIQLLFKNCKEIGKDAMIYSISIQAMPNKIYFVFQKRLESRGHIYEGQYSGWYCVADEAFLSDNQLNEVTKSDGTKIKVSTESGRPVEWTEETNYMFKLSSFQNDLLHWLKDGNSF